MSHSGGVDINYYLKTLEDYNQKYGPRPQNADGTGGQNYGVRASNQAPGYGYINPETNNLFPLNEPGSQGAGGVGASGSFENYLHGLGAQQAPFKYDTNVLSMSEHDGGRTFDYTRPNYSVGQKVPQPGQWNPPAGTGSHDNPDWAWKQNGYNRDEGNTAPNKFDPMYVDHSGGFLGYEEDMQRRYQDELVRSLQSAQGGQ